MPTFQVNKYNKDIKDYFELKLLHYVRIKRLQSDKRDIKFNIYIFFLPETAVNDQNVFHNRQNQVFQRSV